MPLRHSRRLVVSVHATQRVRGQSRDVAAVIALGKSVGDADSATSESPCEQSTLQDLVALADHEPNLGQDQSLHL